MLVDDIFRIGMKHIKNGFPCEDYSTSGYLDDQEHYYIAISDGCSGSNGMTDIGARLWCLSYIKTLKDSEPDELFLDEDFILRMFSYFNKETILPTRNDETASMLLLLANKNKAQILVFGDGGYCIERKDGSIELVEFSWYKNNPYYPVFKLEEEFRSNPILVNKFREKDQALLRKQTKIFRPKNYPLSGVSYVLDEKQTKGYYFEDVEYGYYEIFDKNDDDIISISLFSDGLWSIQNSSLNKIVKDIMLFDQVEKVNNYGFLKSKMVPIFEDLHFKKEYPLDDFSMGTLIW